MGTDIFSRSSTMSSMPFAGRLSSAVDCHGVVHQRRMQVEFHILQFQSIRPRFLTNPSTSLIRESRAFALLRMMSRYSRCVVVQGGVSDEDLRHAYHAVHRRSNLMAHD